MGCSSSSPKHKNSKNNDIKEVTLVPTDVFADIKIIGENKGINETKNPRRTVDYSERLSNITQTKVNESALKIKKYFKNQKPPTSKSELWTDPLFPPNYNSVFALDENGNPTDPITERTKGYDGFSVDKDTLVWKRPKDIFEYEFHLFDEGISIEDVKQGAVGDCYLLSTISSLAYFPQLVLQVFRNLKVQENGCYEIILCIDGEWQIVLVDDWIPCKLEKGTNLPSPLFAKPVGRELWAMLLEKAYAKINGGYKNITGGIMADVMETMTNFPAEYIHHSEMDKDVLWQKIMNSIKNGDLINSGSNNSDEWIHSGLTLYMAGLVSGHAYSLLDARQGIIQSTIVRIIKMRNPWGKLEWKGKWGDKSDLWTEDAKKVLGVSEIKDKNDGIFWMGYDEYLKMFSSSQFCYVMSPLFSKTITIPKEIANEPQLIELCINEKVEVAINGIKPHWRFNRRLQKDSYLQLNMILVKKNSKNIIDENNAESYFSFIDANQNSTPIIKAVLEPGTYLIYSQADFEGAIELDGFDDVYPYRVNIAASEFFDVNYKGIDIDYTVARLSLEKYIKSTKAGELDKKPITFFQGNDIATLSYGYYFLYNNSKEPYHFSLSNSCQNMAPLFPKSFDIPIKLNPGSSFISFGPKRKFQESLVCQFSLITLKNGGNESYCNYDIAIVKKLYADIKLTDDMTEFKSGFIYKKMNIDFNQYFHDLDPVLVAEAFYRLKFPDLMKILLRLKKLEDGVRVKFSDKYVFDDESWSFGETKFDNPKVRHGRTIYKWAKQNVSYVGYSNEGKLHGEGTIYYDQGKSKNVMFDNGKMKGLI